MFFENPMKFPEKQLEECTPNDPFDKVVFWKVLPSEIVEVTKLKLQEIDFEKANAKLRY